MALMNATTISLMLSTMRILSSNMNLSESLSQECGTYLEGFFVRLIERKNLKPEDHELLKYSGRWTNEMGQFENCRSHPHMSYYNIQIGIDLLREGVGICMTDKCTAKDWDFLYDQFNTIIQEGINQPNNSYYSTRDYFKVDFTRVDLEPKWPFKDPVASAFFAIILMVLVTVICVTTKKWIKNPLSPSNSSFDNLQPGEDIFKKLKINRIEMKWSDAFDLRRNLMDMTKYPIISVTQFSIDFSRILYYILILAFQIPFIHSEVSKVLVDKVQSTHYSSGPTAAGVQAILYLPNGLLMIGGFVCTQSLFRSLERFGLERRGKWWKYLSFYVGVIIRRYFRLSFGLLLGMLYVWKILPLLATGPMKDTDLGCSGKSFLSSVLLVRNNFAGNGKRMCGSWYWYFAIDMRLYALAPIISMVYLYSRKLSYISSSLLMVGSMAYNVWYNQTNGIREIHSSNGFWIAEVMTDPLFYGTPYYLGVFLSLLFRSYTYRTHDKHHDMLDNIIHNDLKSIRKEGVHRKTLLYENDTISDGLKEQITKNGEASCATVAGCGIADQLDSIPNRFWEVLSVLSFISLVSGYSVYFFLFQNDNLDSVHWEQWKHTTFNTVGILSMGISPAIFVTSLMNRFRKQVLPVLKSTPSFTILRSIYYEMAICATPLLITMLFSYSTIPFFDPYLVNNSVMWEVAAGMSFSCILYLLVTKPVDLLLTNIMKL